MLNNVALRCVCTGLLIAGLGACAADPGEDVPPTVVGEGGGKADGVEVNITSPNARPGARYLKERSAERLGTVGALTPVMATIVQRMRSYGQTHFGVAALLFVEEPSRYATFLPEERAAFPDLWKLLEIDDTIDLNAAGDFPSLHSLVELRRPDPATLDTSARVSIPALPTDVQIVARRVVKPTTTPPDTISYAEVVTALAAFSQYTGAEYFHFGQLMRAIERAQVTPATFPHFAILQPVENTTQLQVGAAEVEIEREYWRNCDVKYSSAYVSGELYIRVTVPSGTLVTWTPINLAGRLLGYPNYEVDLLTSSGSGYRPPWFLGDGPAPRGLAIVESWQNGQRTAQKLVVLPSNEKIVGDGLAIREGTNPFACVPFDDGYDADDGDSMEDVLRLPPGQYPVPAGTYGTATLNLYGLGVMRLDVGQKSFWSVGAPTPTSSVRNRCWSLTSLGPVNMVTEAHGAGPGFRLNFETGGAYFNENSYNVCAGGVNSGGGSLVATLTEASRL